MSRIRNLAIAGGTFAVALGIGFYMQNGDAVAARLAAQPAPALEPGLEQPADSAAPILAAVQVISGESILSLPGHNEHAMQEPPVHLAALGDVLLDTPPMSPLASTPDCEAKLGGAAGPAAMVALKLEAPCAPDTFGTLHHQGLMFSFLTDMNGEATLLAPALTEQAVFIAELPGFASASTLVEVPDLAQYDRAVLQWEGEAGMQLHALEFGADYDEEGHVWWGAPRDVTAALDGSGGFMIELGRGGAPVSYYAEVYTFPTEAGLANGAVHLSVEAQVGPGNCGTEIAAQSIQLVPGGQPEAVDLTLAMPGCAAQGEYLVLSNMLKDLTLASR